MGESKRRQNRDPSWGKPKLIYIHHPEKDKTLTVKAIEYHLLLKVLDSKMLDKTNIQFEYDYFYHSTTSYTEEEQEFLVALYENVVHFFLKRYLGQSIFNLSVDTKPLLTRQKIKLSFYPSIWDLIPHKNQRLKALLNITHLLRDKSQTNNPTKLYRTQ